MYHSDLRLLTLQRTWWWVGLPSLCQTTCGCEGWVRRFSQQAVAGRTSSGMARSDNVASWRVPGRQPQQEFLHQWAHRASGRARCGRGGPTNLAEVGKLLSHVRMALADWPRPLRVTNVDVPALVAVLPIPGAVHLLTEACAPRKFCACRPRTAAAKLRVLVELIRRGETSIGRVPTPPGLNTMSVHRLSPHPPHATIICFASFFLPPNFFLR